MPAYTDHLVSGETLTSEQFISSSDGRYFLVYQSDGNLVLYSNRDGRALWDSRTAGRPVGTSVMQSDGNLVIYGPTGQAIWNTGTQVRGSELILQNDGNLVIYSPTGQPLWASRTVQPPPPSTISWPWAVLLCRFADVAAVPQPPVHYVDLFARNGTGGVCDYWRAVSGNTLDLTNSRVFGWLTMNHLSGEIQRLRFPEDRSMLVQWGIEAAQANNIDLRSFRGVLVVQNFGVDHGAAGNGILIVHQNSASCEFGFICHEMGHGFGLPHSFAANPDTEYGDGWDLMSFATTTFQFPISFKGTQGLATVGLNARNLEALDAIPAGRTWLSPGPDFSARITLDPLNQPPIGNNGFLVGKITPNATVPRRATNSSFTIEFRRKTGWDRAIPEDAVLIREVRANGISYLLPGAGQRFLQGQQFVTPDPKVFVRMVGINSVAGTANLAIWDVPEGSLRREESKPQVYLIQNGAKRWVTSPQALFALRQTWANVRVVPDAGLSLLPDGPDIL